MKKVAVVYDIVTRQGNSISVDVNAPPKLNNRQRHIMVTLDYYKMFNNRADFIKALSLEN